MVLLCFPDPPTVAHPHGPGQARFLRMAVDHKRNLGFNGTMLIEPKPKVLAPTLDKGRFLPPVCTAAVFRLVLAQRATHMHRQALLMPLSCVEEW